MKTKTWLKEDINIDEEIRSAVPEKLKTDVY